MPPKKTASSTATKAKGKTSPYNNYMKQALAKLKEEKPDLQHKERFKIAAQNWATHPDNPKNKAK